MSKTITSGQPFQDPQGNVIASGSLILTLSQAAEVTSGGGQIAPKVVAITLAATGKIPGSTTIFANDELTPSGTTYTAELLDSGGNIIANFGQWSIAGASPIDLSLQTPTTTGASYPAPVLLNPAGAQTISAFPLLLADGTAAAPSYSFSGATGMGWFRSTTILIGSVGGTSQVAIGSNLAQLPSTGVSGWSTSTIGQATDTGFSRTGAATSALGNGTQGDKTGILQLASIQGPGFKFQQFTGNGTFTIPTGITQVKVTVIGGGGGGGGSANANNGAGGGGAGGTAIKWLTGLTPGNTLTVTVGGGGAGGVSGNNNGGAGNNSTVASGTQVISTITGGAGGAGFGNGNSNGAGGTVGTSSGGDINSIPGSSGTSGQPGASADGGQGGSSFLGSGGQVAGTASAGVNASGAGGGGGGAGSNAANAGGAGAAGLVLFEWIN